MAITSVFTQLAESCHGCHGCCGNGDGNPPIKGVKCIEVSSLYVPDVCCYEMQNR